MTDDAKVPEHSSEPFFVGFLGASRVAAGLLSTVAAAMARAQGENPKATALVFDGATAKVVDLDLRGTEQDIVARLAPPAASPPGRGRPKLGVTPREVTLLPRHWEWLASQPGGASVTLRRLVDNARKAAAGADEARARAEAAYRFMSTMAGDLPGFEEATRALFAKDRAGLESHMAPWPPDIRDETLRFLGSASPQSPLSASQPSG
jgi:hypothetical protein